MKLRTSQFLTLIGILGVTTFSHAQRSTSKVSSDLQALVDAQVGNQQQPITNQLNARTTTVDLENFAPINHLQIFDGKIIIEAIAKEDPLILLRELERMGLEKGSYFGGMVSGFFPVDNLLKLEDMEPLRYVRPAYRPLARSGEVTSQGDVAQLSDVARTSFSVDGSGVRVGVLSDSWDNLGGQVDGIASGDLPADIIILEELPGGGIDEGRAMGEIIYDVAPGTSFAFHTAFLGQPDFANGILELADAGSNVIVDDIIYFAEPMFQDGIIGQAADIVSQNGVSYFSSAGNNLDESYESPFNNGGTYELFDISGAILGEYVLHDFDPGEGVDFFQELDFGPNGGDFLLSFQWDDPFASVCAGCPGADTDLDIFLALGDGEFTSIFADLSSFNFNIGGDPVEIIGVGASAPNVKAYLVIGKWTGRVGDDEFPIGPNPDPELIKYVNFGSRPISEYATKSGTSYGHSNAGRAISVGAVRYDATPEFGLNPPPREVFSSSGGVPTFFDIQGNRMNVPEVREKPEFSAVQGANTTFFGFEYEGDGFPNFFGTSASAPHAAGVAALMLEATGGVILPKQIVEAMQASAVDMDDPRTAEFDEGFDFATGAGFLQADAAIAAAVDVPKVYRYVLIDPINDTPVRTLRDGETIEITLDKNGLFNIEALVSAENKKIKSVKFELERERISKYGHSYKRAFKRTERSAPYALFGDLRGNYLPGFLPTGNYSLETETSAKKVKESGTSLINFSVELVAPDPALASNARTSDDGSDLDLSKELEDLAKDLLNAYDFIVYPNPSSGLVNFIWNAGLEEKVELSIFDISGHLVAVYESEGAFEHAIDFSLYSPGMHFAKIVTPNYTEVRRFIVK